MANTALLSTIGKIAYNYPVSGTLSLISSLYKTKKSKEGETPPTLVDDDSLVKSMDIPNPYIPVELFPSTGGSAPGSAIIKPYIPVELFPSTGGNAPGMEIVKNIVVPTIEASNIYPSNLKETETLDEKIKKYLEEMKNTPWFYPTPWSNYPTPPPAGQPNPWMVDFYAALWDPTGYLAGKYAGGTTGIFGGEGTDIWNAWESLKKVISGKEYEAKKQEFVEKAKEIFKDEPIQSFYVATYQIPADHPKAKEWLDLARSMGLVVTEETIGNTKSYRIDYPSELKSVQESIWKSNIEKLRQTNYFKNLKDGVEVISIGANDPKLKDILAEVNKLGIEYKMVGGAYHIYVKPRMESLTYEGYPAGVMSPTTYSTWVPQFPDLGINPKTGLPYTQEEFNKLPDYQKVAIWMSQLLAPTGQISAAYQQTLAQSLAGQRATIDQLSSVIGKYSGRFDEAWGVGQKATAMLEAAGQKVTSLLNEAEGMLKQAAAMYINATNETRPLYYSLYNAMADIYNQAARLATGVAEASQEMTAELWNQYGDIYNQIQGAYRNVITGTLPAETRQWLDFLKDIQTQAVTETLNKYYEEKQRQLIDELAGRGIVSSRTAATTLSDLGEAVAEQLRQAQYQILADYAKQAIELPFKQYEAALGLLQAPQVGASLLEAARRSMLSYTEPLSLALSAIAQGRGVVSDLASTLINAAQGYQGAAAQLAAMAPQYFTPGQNLLTAARTLSAMAAEGLGAERSALESQYQMWANLPENLRKAFSIYGDMATNLLNILANIYLQSKGLDIAKKQAEQREMASILDAIIRIFS